MIRLVSLREGAAPIKDGRSLAEARTGDRDAFDHLLQRNEAPVRKLVKRRIPKEHAEDVLQEIWLGAWQALPDFDGRSQFGTWLYGIALNKCKNFYRTQQRRPNLVSLDEAVLIATDSAVVDLEAADRLPEAIEALPEKHRQLLDLYYFAELNLPQISRHLGRNLNTVKYQFYRAHAELAELLKECHK